MSEVQLSQEDMSSADEFEAARLEQDEPEGEFEGEEGAEEGDEDEGEPKPAAKAVDWERKAHDKEGQAARERSRRREAERRARELEARFAELESRVAKPQEDDLLALIDQIPDDDEDPIGKMEAMAKALKAYRAQSAKERQVESQSQAQQNEFRQIHNFMTESEADFREDHPDYDEAVKFFRQSRHDELADEGYAGRELEQKLAQDLLGLVKRAQSGSRDPAEIVYNLAKKRGFQSGKQATNDKLAKIAQGARQGAQPRGQGSAPARLTMEYVSSLKGAARDKAFEKLSAQERRAG